MIIKGNLLPLCLFADNTAYPKLSVKVVDIWLFRPRYTLDLCTSTLWTILPKGMPFRWRGTLDLYTPTLGITLTKGTYALNRGGSISPRRGRGKEASWSGSSTAELGIRRATWWPCYTFSLVSVTQHLFPHFTVVQCYIPMLQARLVGGHSTDVFGEYGGMN